MKDEKSGRMIRSQLRLAAELWRGVRQDPIPADRFLSRYFFHNRKKIGSRDRRFISETIYGAFRNKSFLEAWATELDGNSAMNGAAGDEFFCALSAAKEGLLEAEGLREFKIPEKAYGFIRSHDLPPNHNPASPEESLALLYSFPLWLVRRWVERYGFTGTENLLAFFHKRPRLVIRTNTLKIDREELLEWFKRRGLCAERTLRSSCGVILNERKNILDTEAFRDGWFEIQDEGSQLVCQKMEVRPGEIIWDVCAGGGGKSLSLAAIMGNKGRIVATDLRTYKLDEIKKRAKRAGAFNIFPADLGRMNELTSAQKGFDKILVDAPCSGTGTFSRNPDAKWRIDESWLTNLPAEQFSIIEKALPYLKKNGRLYYVTCSLEPVENEGVVQKVLSVHPEMRKIPCGEQGGDFFKLWPVESGTDGFFLATLEKI
ncbi:MAG: Ribosomal RNA small subunit methyltransferase B [Candidatus Omnitrophica bacterium ADurb.Bin277]|nr:MAG: Ribosomal RNA small subunit methyltransferase B [Candidatus Omnitrophica bacterium ADurb.Bin277]